MHTLLLADDSITVQRVVALMFAAEDVRVVAASSGSEAVERMSTDRPDVVLVATTLPGMTGYDLSRYVRDQKALKGVPVLLMSGAFEAVDEARLESSGAAGIVEKPIEPTTVISRVKELLGLKKDPPASATNTGRLVTPAGGPRDRQPGAPSRPAGGAPASGAGPRTAPGDRGRPLTPPPGRSAPPASKAPASTWDELRRDTLEPDAKSVEATRQSGDVLDSLGDAFDSLDAQLSGRPDGAPKAAHGRAPIAPAARGVSAKDSGSPVYEVDDDWFGDAARADDARASERRELAAEMGIHDIELPESEKPATPVADLDFDFGIEATTTMAEEARRAITADLRDIESEDLSPPEPSSAALEMTAEIADLKTELSAAAAPPPPPAPAEALPAPAVRAPKVASRDAIAELLGAFPKPPAEPPKPAMPAEPVAPPRPPAPPMPPPAISVKAPEPIAPVAAPPVAAPPVVVAPPPVAAPVPVQREVPPAAPPVVIASGPPVADAFDALFALEQGDPRGLRFLASEPPPPPEITGEMLDHVAAKVAQQLGEGALGEQLRQALARSVTDTVREVVAATSERVVRDTVREVVTATAERVVRETVRDVVAETSERVAREVLGPTADHVAREVLSATAERVAREVLPETAARVAREVLAETSARVVREVVSETSERVVREAVTDTAERLVRQTVSDTSERLVRDEIARIRAQAGADESVQD